MQALTLHVDGQVLIALYVELEALLAETSRARLALFMYPQVSWGVSNGLGMRARLQRGMLLHADAQACFPVQLKELPCAALVPSMTGEGGIPPPRPFPYRRCEGACKGRRLRYDPHGQPHRHHLRRRIGTGSASHCAPACRCPMPPLWQMWAETSRPHVLVWECWRAGRIATRRGFRPSANRSARAQFGLDGVW